MFGVSKLELYGALAAIVLAIVGAAYMYYSWSESKILALTMNLASQTLKSDSLSVSLKALQADVENIKQATDKANSAISDARQKASLATRTVRTQDFSVGKTKPRELEVKINADLNAQFKALEGSSNVH